LPLCFLLVWVFAAIGAAIHHPNNYDHLTYRFPRLLHYWTVGSWHWIEGGTARLNYSGLGFEWSWFPFFLLFKSDWSAALLNLVAFACLPGQTFRFLRYLGVQPKLASIWMWVIPAGYGYVAQAGSVGNDLIGAFFFLFAINCAFQASRHADIGCLAFCILASALLTAVKISNAPLLLPVAIACLSGGAGVFKMVLQTRLLPAIGIGTIVSCATSAALNIHNTGSWTGDPANSDKLQISNPVAGITGNVIQVGIASVWPPVNPLAGRWNEIWPQISPENFQNWLRGQYPRWRLDTREIQGEEDAGLGLGFFATLLCTFFCSKLMTFRQMTGHIQIFFVLGIWISFLVFMAKMGSESAPRLALPYYPAVVGTLFVPFSIRNIRSRKVLRTVATVAVLSAFPMLILNPSRPLWPWRIVVDSLALPAVFKSRLSQVYETYGNRWDAFAPLRAMLPENTIMLGFVSNCDDPETSLWRPFGSRKVVLLDNKELPASNPSVIVARTDDFINQYILQRQYLCSAKLNVTTKASKGPEEWTVWVDPEQRSLNAPGNKKSTPASQDR